MTRSWCFGLFVGFRCRFRVLLRFHILPGGSGASGCSLARLAQGSRSCPYGFIFGSRSVAWVAVAVAHVDPPFLVETLAGFPAEGNGSGERLHFEVIIFWA